MTKQAAVAFLALAAGVASPAAGMSFSLITLPSGLRAILGDGPIVEGDADRLAALVPHAGRDRYNHVPFYLNSPGGSVVAAFEMVDVLDSVDMTVIVGSGAVCGSACAAILFVSGRYHDVLGTGQLALHSCFVDRNGTIEPSAFCNSLFEQNALAHGTSVGAIRLFVDELDPGEIVWVGRDEACSLGLCGPPGFDGSPFRGAR